MLLRWLITLTFVIQFVAANLIILALAVHKAISNEGIKEATLLIFFGATVAELAGVVILIAKYLFPLARNSRETFSDSLLPHYRRKRHKAVSRDTSGQSIAESSNIDDRGDAEFQTPPNVTPKRRNNRPKLDSKDLGKDAKVVGKPK